MAVETYEGALIGLGNIAVRAHLPAFAQDAELREHVRIVAAVDPVEARRRQAEERVPGLRTYGGIQELFEHERLDFVDICATPDAHTALAHEALRRGQHVLCEKPVARTLAGALRLAEAMRDTAVLLAPCHQYRYSRVWSALRAWLREGRLGTLGIAQIEVLRSGHDPGAPDARPHWRVNPEVAGGGILVDTGIHYFYLLARLFGWPPSVRAYTRSLGAEATGVEDTAVLLFELPETMVCVTLTWAAQRRETRFTFLGSRAAAIYDGERLRLLEDGRTVEEVRESLSDKATYVGWYVGLFREFFARLRDPSAGAMPPGMDEALGTLRVLEACYRSAADGRTVAIDVER